MFWNTCFACWETRYRKSKNRWSHPQLYQGQVISWQASSQEGHWKGSKADLDC